VGLLIAAWAWRSIWPGLPARRGCLHHARRLSSADATPLWIPQLCMAIGCAAFALAFLDAIVARWRGREWFIAARLGG
jgi:TRAP-type C4-dicarboxylate transport system permease small subunit